MANNNIEIEIKLPVAEAEFERLKSKLNKLAVFKKSSRQIDEYFTPAHRDFLVADYPFEWLSIRQRGDKTILNYKHWHPENQKIVTYCDEFETEVENRDQLVKIFSAIDIKSLCVVDKERLVYRYQDEIEIGLDTVKDLGYYIELETIKDFGRIETAREKLFAFAKELGCDTSKPDLRGYPYLLLEKLGKL